VQVSITKCFPKILFVLFICHVIFNLERYIFVNEMFSLVGLICCFSYCLRKEFKFDKITFSVNILFLYLAAYAVFSFLLYDGFGSYQFLRTLPVIYSIPCFYLGCYFVEKLDFFGSRVSFGGRHNFYSYVGFFVSILAVIKGGRLSNSSIFPLFLKDIRYFRYLVPVFLLLMLLYKEGMTTLVLFVFYFMISLVFLFPKLFGVLLGWRFVTISVVASICAGVFVFSYFGDFYYDGWSFFQGYGDNNALWRLMFWAYLIDVQVIENLIFGIGFGVPLFDVGDPRMWFVLQADPFSVGPEYTMGPHNSFLYLLVRSGVLGLFLFLIVVVNVCRLVLVKRLYLDGYVYGVMCSFLFITVAACFNVVLESPLYSGVFWVLLGSLYRIARRAHAI
jgi:O-Antigen ligase